MHWVAGIFASLQAGDFCHCRDQGQAGSHGPACHRLQGGLQLSSARFLSCPAFIHCIFYCPCAVVLSVLSVLARLVLKVRFNSSQQGLSVLSCLGSLHLLTFMCCDFVVLSVLARLVLKTQQAGKRSGLSLRVHDAVAGDATNIASTCPAGLTFHKGF